MRRALNQTVRIASKPATVNLASAPATLAKQTGASFIDMLERISGDAVQPLQSAGGDSEGQAQENPNSDEQVKTSGPGPVVSQEKLSGTILAATDSPVKSPGVDTADNELCAIIHPAKPVVSANREERPSCPDRHLKAAQSDQHQDANSMCVAADEHPSQDLVDVQASARRFESSCSDSQVKQANASDILSVFEFLPASFRPNSSLANSIKEPGAANPSATEANQDSSATSANSPEPTSLLSLPKAAPAIETLAENAFRFESVGLANSVNRASQSKSANAGPPTSAACAVSSSVTSGTRGNTTQEASSTPHANLTDRQASQQAQAGETQSIPVASKALDASASQSISLAMHAPSAAASAPQTMSASNGEAPYRAQDQGDLLSGQPERASVDGNPGVNTARLIQSMSESEMRLGIHSAEFGDISIRTTVSQQQLQAQINVGHGELGSTISAHLPALEAKLGSDFGLHASIEVNQAGASFSGGQGQSSQQNHNFRTNQEPATGIFEAAEKEPQTVPGSLVTASDSRLDIRA